jgi:hypothetical protein
VIQPISTSLPVLDTTQRVSFATPLSTMDSLSDRPITDERLPFSVRIVRNDEDLSKAIGIRHSAYARHMPVFAEKLREAEPLDGAPGVAVLLAESRLDGSALGTLRIQTNAHVSLTVEQSIDLPRWMRDRPLAEVTRLGITGGSMGRLVKMVLIKAAFQYCEHDEIEWAVVAARPPLDRQYAQLMFEELYPKQGLVPLRHVDNIPHRVMAFEIDTGHQRWAEADHPLLNFFSYTRHPDIALQFPRPMHTGELFPHPSMTRVAPLLGRVPV